MRIRYLLLASLAVAVTGANMAFGQINVFWNGGDGNFTDDNWVDGDGISVIPFGTDNIFIPSGSVTIDTDLTAAEGAFGSLTIGDATVDCHHRRQCFLRSTHFSRRARGRLGDPDYGGQLRIQWR